MGIWVWHRVRAVPGSGGHYILALTRLTAQHHLKSQSNAVIEHVFSMYKSLGSVPSISLGEVYVSINLNLELWVLLIPLEYGQKQSLGGGLNLDHLLKI